MKPLTRALPGVLVALITAIVYLPSLGSGFVEWDDHVYVYESEGLGLKGAAFLSWAATAVVSSNWHPLTLLSYGIDYELWGLAPFGYHLTNLLLHSVNTALVFMLAARLLRLCLGGSGGRGPVFGAFLAALVFGVHPQHVESVAWVSERKDVLSALFFLISLLSYLSWKGAGRRRMYALSLASFVAAFLSKPMAITLPVVLLLLDWYPLGALGRASGLRRLLVEKAPFLVLAPVFAAATIWAQHGDAAMASLAASPLHERFDVAVRGLAFYLWKLVAPVGLAPFYVRPLEGEFYNTGFFLSLLAVAAITAASVAFRKSRALAAAWAYYVVTLSPVIGLVQVSDMAAADRYSYLPTLGPVLFAAGLLARFASASSARLAAAAALSLPVLAALVFLAVGQQSVWKDTVSLWTQEIKVYPTVQAYMKRARAHEKAGMHEEAAADYTVVLENSGEEAAAQLYMRRGGSYMRAGRPSQAALDYEQALRLAPGSAAAMYNLGLARISEGQRGEGLRLVEEAARGGLREAEEFLSRQGRPQAGGGLQAASLVRTLE